MTRFDTILGYAYDAEVHCEDCAIEKFGEDALDDNDPPTDDEGNDIHPIFASDECSEDTYCADCGEIVQEAG